MRFALPLIVATLAAPLAAQQPPRRTADARALRALLEAEQSRAISSIELQRRLLEAQHAAQSGPLRHRLAVQQRALTSAHADVERALAAAHAGMTRVPEYSAEQGPAEAWAPQDPADSLYRTGREQLNRGNYRDAVRLFGRISSESRFARSEYRPAAYYWQAFALTRLGSEAELRRAREQLTTLRSSYPRHELLDDAASLAATIDSHLARTGDAAAREAVYEQALAATRSSDRAAPAVAAGGRARVASTRQQCEDDDIRSVALNALLQMESANAVPILREVMARRDECSAPLRRRAMMMLAQHQSADAQDILIEAALEDPDPEVREQATFWLSHVRTDAAVEALARILSGSPSADVQQRAVFALGQHPNARAGEILRDYALRDDIPDELRRQIVFSLAHTAGGDNATFLRQMYERSNDAELKSYVVMALSTNPTAENADWVMEIALDARQPEEVRRHALMMAMHNQSIGTERIVRVYDQTEDPELRRMIVTALTQRIHDRAALDKLIDIARTTEDAELQKQVIIMLGQSRDPRVAELLAEIIRRPVR
jgi:HEAT repeat protein